MEWSEFRFIRRKVNFSLGLTFNINANKWEIVEMIRSRIILSVQSVCLLIFFTFASQAVLAHRGKHNSNDTLWSHYWYWAGANYHGSGDKLNLSYRDNGKSDTHCVYARTRMKGSGYAEFPKNCSTTETKTVYQTAINLKSGRFVGAQWRVCRTGHWKCHPWWN